MKKTFLLGVLLAFPLFAHQAPSEENIAKLIQAAIAGQKKAYAPYSHYHVGAAVLTKSGKIYSGCNIENASYGLTNCAERTAVFKAVSEGEKDLQAVVVATRDGGTACGTCRQILNEFNPDMLVISVDESGAIKHRVVLKELLPVAFGPANLN